MGDGASCPNCGASLEAGGEEAVCPECRNPLQADEPTIIPPAAEAPTLIHEEAGASDASAETAAAEAVTPGRNPGTLKKPAFAESQSRTIQLGEPLRRFGDYELIEEIARGGMGVVYKARQVSLNRIVALKMILAGQLASEQDVQRFHTEAEAAANLDHPGIVPIHEIGEHEGQHYFSMGFVEGLSLAEKLREGPLPVEQAAGVVLSVAEAVAYAHERGVIHRDLKPANVLLELERPESRDESQREARSFSGLSGSRRKTFELRPRITDFGLAKRTEAESQLTGTGQVLGTPSFMPPEQAGGQSEVGPKADVYSLGALLYCLLIGRPPFQAASPMETLLQVLNEEPVPPRQLNAAVPRDLETICLKCLQKEPHRRYQSAAALAEDLKRFLADEPIVARPIGRLERGWKWARRRPGIAALSAAVFFVAAAGFAGVTWQWGRAEFQRGEAESARQVAEQKKDEAESAQRVAERERQKALDALEEAETHLYFNRVTLAHGRWLANTVRRAEELLEECPPERRGWEWHYLRRLCRGDSMTLEGHGDWINALAYSPAGDRLASGSKDGTVRIWDTVDGREVHVLAAHERGVEDIDFSPDGDKLASVGGGRSIRIWDVQTGETVQTLTGHRSYIRAVAFSPDGRYLISGGTDRTLHVCELSSGRYRPTLRGHASSVSDVVCIPGGSLVASASFDGTVRLWDYESGEQTKVLPASSEESSALYAVTVSPDRRLLAAAGRGQTVLLWDLAADRQVRVLRGHTATIADLAFSPDSRRLVTASYDRSAKVWDARAGRELFTIRGHYGTFHAAAFSPDGERIATGAADRNVKIWDPGSPQEYRILPRHDNLVHSVACVGREGRIVSASLDGTIRTGDETARESEPPLTVGDNLQAAFSPNGNLVAVVGLTDAVAVWDLNTHEKLLEFSGHTGRVETAAFHPDGELIASGGRDQTVRLWEARTGREVRVFTGHENWIIQTVFSPDGRRLATSGRDRRVRVWEVATGEVVLNLFSQTHPFNCLAFSPDGSRIAIAPGQRVAVWQIEPLERKLLLRGHAAEIRSVAFSPDGERIASASGNRAIKLWDAATGHEALNLAVPQGIGCVAFSANGESLISGNDDGTLSIFEAAPVEQ